MNQVPDTMHPALPTPAPAEVALSSESALAKNVFANWVGYFVVLVCGFILPRFVNDHIGQSQLGIWDFGWSMVAYLGLLGAGVASSVNRYVARHLALRDWDGLNRTVNSCALIFFCAGTLAAIISTILVFLMPIMPSHVFDGELVEAQWMMFMLGLAAMLNLYSTVYNGVITGHARYDLVAKIEVACNILRLGGILGVLEMGCDLVAMAGVVLLVTLLEGVSKFIMAHRICPQLHRSIKSITPQSLRDVLFFGGKTFIWGIARICLYQGNSLLIGLFLGPAALAIFARALVLVTAAEQGVFQFARVLVPMASSAEASEDRQSLPQLVLMGSRYSNLISLPIALSLIILGPALMSVWMGPQYAVLPLLSILAAGHLVALTQVGPVQILQGMNRHGTPALAFLAASGLCIAMNSILLGVFKLGLMAVSIGLGTCLTLLSVLVTPALVSKAIGMSIPRYLSKTVSSCWLVIPFALWLLMVRGLMDNNKVLQLICGMGGGAVILLLSYWKTVVPPSIKAKFRITLGRRA